MFSYAFVCCCSLVVFGSGNVYWNRIYTIETWNLQQAAELSSSFLWNIFMHTLLKALSRCNMDVGTRGLGVRSDLSLYRVARPWRLWGLCGPWASASHSIFISIIIICSYTLYTWYVQISRCICTCILLSIQRRRAPFKLAFQYTYS